MDNSITHVALDAHKAEHKVAALYPETDMNKPEESAVHNEPAKIRRMVERIVRKAPGRVLFCYEAGVCGFALQRQIIAAGAECIVRRRSGDHLEQRGTHQVDVGLGADPVVLGAGKLGGHVRR